jgi:hypothetical protein
MKSKKKLILAGLAIALVAMVATALVVRSWHDRQWPDFLTDKQDAPRYNTEVKDRDFGYRTGNHVPLALYFKLLPGMELMTDQMVVNGDFEVVSRTEYRERRGDDTLVRVDLVLQAFVLKPKLEAKPTIAYKSTPDGEPKKLDLLTVEVYTSQTFDGRKSEHPKEANLAEIDDGHLWVTGAYILAGGIGLVLAVGMLVRSHVPRLKTKPKAKVSSGPFPTGWAVVQEAWVAITGGDTSKTAFTRVAELSRTFFGVGPLTVSELANSTLPEKEPLIVFLSVCEKALWTDTQIGGDEMARAQEAFAAIEALLLGKSSAPAKV